MSKMCFVRSLLFRSLLRHVSGWRISLRGLLHIEFDFLKLFALQGV
jgi:hypothetical protein